MPSLISGETVTVLRPVRTRDELGEPGATVWEPQEVGDVVVCPGATSDLDASRPDGVEVAFTLCFPKSFAGSLRGCRAKVRGEVFGIVGDPKPYTAANTPGDWNLTAEAARCDG